MISSRDIAVTALAPIIWGSTYIVTTEFLPGDAPISLAMLRALLAGIVLMLIVRRLPDREWISRIVVLGALNFSIFWVLLFVAAYRLPGGVAATVGSIQALFVIFLSRAVLGTQVRVLAVVAAVMGMGGVALLLLTPSDALDPLGVIAGLGGAASMAAGSVLSRRWRAPVPAITFTSWQLMAGGVLLLPFAVAFEPSIASYSPTSFLALAYLSIIGAALTYVLWIRGLDRIPLTAVSALGFLSPLSAVALGWLCLGQTLSVGQFAGALIVLTSVWFGQRAATNDNAGERSLTSVSKRSSSVNFGVRRRC